MSATAVRRQPQLRAEELTGRQKVAILLMALGPEASAQITQALSPEELEEISLEIARIDHVPPEVAEAVIQEWRQTEEAAYSLASGGVEYARELLERTVGPQGLEKMACRFKKNLKTCK